MARKRRSSEMEQQVWPTASSSERNPEALLRDYNTLCETADLELQYETVTSPNQVNRSNIKTQAYECYKFLWWQHRAELDQAVAGFLDDIRLRPIASWRSEEKTNKLLERLTALRKEKLSAATPHTRRFHSPVPNRTGEPSSPESPTRRKGNGIPSQFTVSKLVSRSSKATEPPAIFAKPTLPLQTAKTSFATTSATTSFATNATKSFNSFWSNPGSSGSQESQLTQLTQEFVQENDVEPSKSSSYYFPSLSPSEIAEATTKIQPFELSQTSNSTNTVIPPEASTTTADRHPSPRESTFSRDTLSTDYGSFIDPADADRMQTECTRNLIDKISLNHELPRQNIEEDDVIQLRLPKVFESLPFDLQWAAQRLLQSENMSEEKLVDEWHVRNINGLYEYAASQGVNLPKPPLPTTLKKYEMLTRNGRLEWTKSKTEPVFDMVLQVESKDTANSIQRRVGPDRVLYLEVPELTKPPIPYPGKDVQTMFQRWLKRPHKLLGRQWYPFFLQPNKKKSAFEGRATACMNRLILVSPKQGETISQLLEWALPFRTNCRQAARKAFMRLELLLSRTIIAAELEPKDFAYRVPDQLANRDPDDRRFEDPKARRHFFEEFDPNIIMNDGTNKMSTWIARQYMKAAGLPRIPAALQMRTAGAKGLWFVDDHERTISNEKPPGPLIWLSDSQVKVFRDSLYGCDKLTLSVAVVKPNPGARPAILHILFLPILVDRGVPVTAIRELVTKQVKREMDEFLEALKAPGSLPLRRWLASHNEFFEARTRESNIGVLAKLPRAPEERIIQLLESGFEPKKCKFLAKEVRLLAKSYFDLKRNNFKLHLPKSTTLMGTVDPYGILNPGEISVVFGTPFDDPSTGESWWQLNNMEVLIARNPALAPSDIQKVRCVFDTRLSRFQNLVVFPRNGMRSLAGKLQGGDYDGDAFWFTWDSSLVKEFKNYPAPWKPPPPQRFGIQKDARLLGDMIQDSTSDQQWCDYLGEMTWKRMGMKMLGIATLFHERVIYGTGRIDSESAWKFAHLHDYLVDADKQGYDYSQADFDAFKKTCKLPLNLPAPAYWAFTRPQDDNQPEMYNPGSRKINNNIIDTVFFDIVEPIIQEATDHASKVLSEAGLYDDDLSRFWNLTFESFPKRSPIHKELLHLKDSLKPLRQEWSLLIAKAPFPYAVERVRTLYDAITPLDPLHPTVVEWLRKQGNSPTTWDKLKASCLAREHSNSPDFLFRVAGHELCHLKYNELEEDTRTMLVSQYQALKLRRVRKLAESDEFDQDNDDPDDLLSEAGYG